MLIRFQYCKFTLQKIYFSIQLNLKSYDQDEECIPFEESLEVSDNPIIRLPVVSAADLKRCNLLESVPKDYIEKNITGDNPAAQGYKADTSYGQYRDKK